MPSPPPNHYDTLEVSPAASPEVLRAAYKSLIQRLHPDRNPGDAAAAERSARVVKAYQVLSDPAARAAYDLELRRLTLVAARPVAAPPAALVRRSAPAHSPLHTVLWATPVLVLVFLFWLFWRETARPGPLAAPAPMANAGANSPAPPRQVGRTLDDFVTRIAISLGASESRSRLEIRSLSLVAGGFEAERFVEFAARNRDYLGGKLVERLAGADPRLLAGERGEAYLKQFILDALADIANTRRIAADAPATVLASHYGAADILLPEGFSVEPRLPPPAPLPGAPNH